MILCFIEKNQKIVANNVNITHNIDAHKNLSQHKDSISDIRNKGDVATAIHGGQYPRYVREAIPDDAEDEHVAETIRILRKQQKAIMAHLSKHD